MKKILSILLLLVAFTTINAQDCLLDQKPVQNLVQDYAGILTKNITNDGSYIPHLRFSA